ncbi:MAG: hypothetical protein RI962_1330, partial [Pseudomonadota bacterium]
VYLQRAAQFPHRIRVIDSTRPIADISREVQQIAADVCGV